MSQAENKVLPKDFGERLRWFRNQAGISQGELGETVNRKATSVSEWEKGESEPSLEVIAKLAARLGASPQRLAFGDTAEPTSATMHENAQAAYVNLRTEPGGGVTPGNGPSDTVEVNPRYRPPGNPPTRQQVEAYLKEYLDIAASIPGGFGHALLELKAAMPLEKIRKLAAQQNE